MRDDTNLPPLRDPYRLIGTPVPDGQVRAEFLLFGPGMVETRYLIQFPVTLTGEELISWLTEQFNLVSGRWGLEIEGEDGTLFWLHLGPTPIVRRQPPHLRMTISFHPNRR